MYSPRINRLSPFEKLVLGGVTLFVLNELLKDANDTYGDENCKPRVFISHSWKHSHHYEGLRCKLICSGLDFSDHSIPQYKKVQAPNASQIRTAITKKIKGCSTVVVFGGMYANSYWIREEVRIAKELGKEILVVKPRGAKRIPKYLRDNKSTIVGSYAPSIVSRIRCVRNP